MSNHRVIYVFLFIFFGSIYSIIAQNTSKEKRSLVEILSILQQTYNIHFSYLDQTIADKTSFTPDTSLTLEEALKFLETETNLDYIIIDETSVVISNRSNPFSSFITQKLEEIVITNYLTKGISKKSDGKISFETEQFGILPGLIEPDILQTIQALPGVMSVDETVSNINVRGGTHDQNLILWDGIKMYQSGHFFGLVSAFNPYLITNVNVSKNGTSVKYGDGVSSVIDMQQSNILDADFKAGAGFNLISADAFAKIPLSKKTELQVSARRSITDLIFTPTYDQYFKRVFQDSDFNNDSEITVANSEEFYFYDASAKFLYDISDSDQLRFNFLTINNQLNYDEQLDGNASTSTLEQNNIATGVEYLKYWNNKLTTTAQLSWSSYELSTNNNDVSNNQQLLQDNEVSDLNLKINATNHIDSNLKIHGGYQFNEVIVSNREDVTNPEFIRFVKRVNRTHAIYGEAEFTSANKKTYARIGLRTNYVEQFSDFYTEPRLAISHKLSNDFRLEFLGEFKSQTISQIIELQNDFLGLEKRRWQLSNNDDIPIIKSGQASLGIHYNKNKLLISIEGFLKDVEGITTRSQGFQNQYQFVNAIGRYQTLGLDFLINKQFENFSSWLSYSYSTNNYTFEELNNGDTFPNNLDIRHTANFSNTYTYKNFKFALGFNWHSGKPATFLQDNQNTSGAINYESPNAERLKDYFRTDVSTTYQFQVTNKVNASVGASIWNLFNQKNILNSYYNRDSDNQIIKIDNIALGITPNVSFRVNF
uniref:TonB-dependent receptor plug domain-containing protein n=1 Tax=Gelidibacter sp. TaxID=2018083 RepID=UPI00404B4A11